MGNDGGSIPDRRDLVKSKPKAEQADKANQTRARWGFCALSKKPLQEPVVSCRLGRLYNKDALIEFLLDRTLYGDGKNICGHIKTLKDVKALTLTPNPQWSKRVSDTDLPIARFVCPLTMKEMNGAVPFVYLRSCGCVFSQGGLRAMSSTPPKEPNDLPKEQKESKEGEIEKKLCPQCNSKYDPIHDVFTINPGPEEEAQMLERLLLLPKIKSKKRKAVESVEDAPEAKSVKTETSSQTKMNTQISRSSKKVTEGIAEQEKKRLAGMSDAVRSIYLGKNPKGNNRTNWISQGTFTRYAA